MRVSIIAILLSISAFCFAQESTDTIAITSVAHKEAMPELLEENKSLREQLTKIQDALNHNAQKIMLIVTAYVDDPKKLVNITEDGKIVVKK